MQQIKGVSGVQLESVILAAFTTDKEAVAGGVPIFYADNEQTMEEMAASLANILDGMVHQLAANTMIIVKH